MTISVIRVFIMSLPLWDCTLLPENIRLGLDGGNSDSDSDNIIMIKIYLTYY